MMDEGMSGQLLVKLLLHWATSSLMPLFSQLLLLSGLLLLWTASAPSYFPLSATSYFCSFCNPSSVRAASAVPFATSSQTWHYAQKSLDESEPNVIRIISLGPTWLVKNVGAYKNIWKKKLPWPWYKKRCLWNLLAIGPFVQSGTDCSSDFWRHHSLLKADPREAFCRVRLTFMILAKPGVPFFVCVCYRGAVSFFQSKDLGRH